MTDDDQKPASAPDDLWALKQANPSDAEMRVIARLIAVDVLIDHCQEAWREAFPELTGSSIVGGSLILHDAQRYVRRARHAAMDRIKQRAEARENERRTDQH